MTEFNSIGQKALADQNETPEDVATLYSWANLHGAKYRDFSASRAQAREEARVRVEEAQAIERHRLNEEAERVAQEEAQIAARLAAEAAEAARQEEAERLAEIARQAEAEHQAVVAAQEAQRQALLQRSWQAPVPEADHEPSIPITPESSASAPLYANSPSISPRMNEPDSFSGFTYGQPYTPASSRDFVSFATPSYLNPAANSPFSDYDRASQQGHAADAGQSVDQGVNQGAYPDQLRRPETSIRPAAPVQPPTQFGSLPPLAAPSYLSQPRPVYPSITPSDASLASQATPRAESFSPFQSNRYEQQPYQLPNYPTIASEFSSAPASGHPLAQASSDVSHQQQPQLQTPNQNSGYPLPSAPPVGPVQADPYFSSPWQSPTPRQPSLGAEQDYREQREPVSRPAWLGQDFAPYDSPTPLRPSAAPVQPTPAAHNLPVQAQYTSGAMVPSGKGSEQPQKSEHGPVKPTNTWNQPPTAYQPYIPQQPTRQAKFFEPVQPARPFPSAQPTSPASPQASQPNQPLMSPAHPTAPTDAAQHSHDRLSNRWYALKSVFDPQVTPEQSPAPASARVPALAVFSLAGGVGKTSIVAALGRALSSRGERVLMIDTAAYGLLPFFFGARDQRPGMLRTFNPPGVSAESPIQLVTLDPDGNPPEAQSQDTNRSKDQDWLTHEVIRLSRGSSRMLIDLPTASGATTRRILKLSPTILVPVVPDMSSVVSVGAIESFFRHSAPAPGFQNSAAQPNMPQYVLNQFDYSLPLHQDVREILCEQLGDRLLPFALRRSPAISEALAEGMTVIDYAPSADVAEDYANLAAWSRTLAAPANIARHGVRWSER